jgi:hypothetical protein
MSAGSANASEGVLTSPLSAAATMRLESVTMADDGAPPPEPVAAALFAVPPALVVVLALLPQPAAASSAAATAPVAHHCDLLRPLDGFAAASLPSLALVLRRVFIAFPPSCVSIMSRTALDRTLSGRLTRAQFPRPCQRDAIDDESTGELTLPDDVTLAAPRG